MSVIEAETDEQVVNSGWLTPIAILMIGLGMIAIVFPFFASIASILAFGWIFIFAGIAQMVYAFQSRFQSRGSGQFVWKLILGLLYLLAGILFVVAKPLEAVLAFVLVYLLAGTFVVAKPFEGIFAFTLVLGITLFVQGIIQVSIAFQLRRMAPNWEWMLVSGIIGIIFGIFVWSSFPSGAAWLVGTLIGVNLLFDGVWMLTLHSGRRGALS